LYKNPLTATTFEQFQKNCTQHLTEAKPELEPVVTLNCLLKNLFTCIASLVVPYAIASMVNYYATGSFLFFKSSPALESIEKIETSLLPRAL
jgi:hypothetical protein